VSGTFQLRVVSPESVLLEAEVSSVRFPGGDGFFGVLPRHAAMVSLTDSGPLTSRTSAGETLEYLVHDGFAEVRGGALTILTRSAEKPADVDLERARRAAERARERIRNDRTKVDYARAYSALRRAIAREKYGRRS
jgi:F-type H+-transporting ATPase subunit epsilon